MVLRLWCIGEFTIRMGVAETLKQFLFLQVFDEMHILLTHFLYRVHVYV